MIRPDFDKKIWNKIMTFFLRELEGRKNVVNRQKNQLEAYWCRPDGMRQNLYADPRQRIFARFIKSYLNTTWHQVQLSLIRGNSHENTNGNRRKLITDSWFDNSDIIKTAQDEIVSNAFFHNSAHLQNDFVPFCKMAIAVVENLELKEYKFDHEQKENFESLRKVISVFFEDMYKRKELKVSEFEKIIYMQFQEPYQTIMKMQKLFPGFGIALTCDFLKESHLCNIAKPDVHISHVFSVIDGIPYSMDLALVKRVAEFAQNACPPGEKNFCNTGSYNIDKIIWSTCSDYMTEADRTKSKLKGSFLKQLTGTML